MVLGTKIQSGPRHRQGFSGARLGGVLRLIDQEPHTHRMAVGSGMATDHHTAVHCSLL